MPKFNLSQRSIKRLQGVHKELCSVVSRAIVLTTIDFGVSEGLRTLERQKELVKEGKSQTMKSNHLTGHAVDLVAFIDGKVNWDHDNYVEIAEAVRKAAEELKVGIRWGGAWKFEQDDHVGHNIVDWRGSMQELTEEYVSLRRSEGGKPFLDMPHFELNPVRDYQ